MVNNIPKGQFCRLRQNCTRDCDYISQSVHLKNKFLEKGYPNKVVNQAYTTFLPGKRPKTNKPPENVTARCITRYYGKYKEDPLLNISLSDRPKVTYRRAPTLKNKIVPSKLKSIKIDNPLCLIPLIGIYRCNKPLCKTCTFVRHGQQSFQHKDKTYHLDKLFNCSTDYVVYCLTCPCKLLYVGLPQRFGKHRHFVEVGFATNIAFPATF